MEKHCDDCKYYSLSIFEEPCNHCDIMKNMWEPKEKKTMVKEFTKNMLKDGMVVETRDGSRYLVCGNRLIGMDGVIRLSSYDDVMLHKGMFEPNRNYDIMKVYDKADSLRQVVSILCLHLLWERKPDVKEVTLKEIAEKFGVDEVKVIDD